MSEFTSLIAAVVFGAIVAASTVGGGVTNVADRIFNPQPHADFSAKFVRP